MTGTITATFELEPAGSAEAVAIEESTGMPGLDSRFDAVRGRVVSEEGGRAVLEFPADNWGRNIGMLVSALVAGEAVETRAFTRCRLVGLELPPGLFAGPAYGARSGVGVGVIIKPSLGLTPSEVAAVASEAARCGAVVVKDDELLGDPEWCRLDERVAAVADVLPPSALYCPNITGDGPSLIDRARRVVDRGATGVMINGFAQGLDAVVALRDADLGVPILVHRVASGPLARNERFGVTGAVLAGLLRACGADFVLVGAYGGKLFDTDDEIDDQIAAARGPIEGMRRSTVLLGGGIGPDNARAQADRAGVDGLLLLLGSAAYRREGGLGTSVRATVEALS